MIDIKTQTEIKRQIKALVGDLVHRRFKQIIDLGRAGHFDEEIFERVLNEYPGQITIPPDEAYESYDLEQDLLEITPSKWVGYFDLYYDNQRSDLTLIYKVYKLDNGDLLVTIDDIHVM